MLSPIASVHTKEIPEMRDIHLVPEMRDISYRPRLMISSPVLGGTPPTPDDLVGDSNQFAALEPELAETPPVDYSDAHERDWP